MFVALPDLAGKTPEITELIKRKILLNSKKIIFSFKMFADEQQLDLYLKNTIGLGLKPACIAIINSTKLFTNSANEIVLKTDPEWEKIVQLINYGNGIIHGSDILQKALYQNYI